MSEATTRAEEDTRALIADLERELGVTGTAAVFRTVLAMAKETAAAARTRQDAYAANDLAYRLRCWGENDPDPEFFTGDLLHGVLLDCGAGSEAILTAESRAASAEAEVERLTGLLKEATVIAECRVSAASDAEYWADHAKAAEASASALRDRVAVLESALKQIVNLHNAPTPCDDAIVAIVRAARAALNGADHE